MQGLIDQRTYLNLRDQLLHEIEEYKVVLETRSSTIEALKRTAGVNDKVRITRRLTSFRLRTNYST